MTDLDRDDHGDGDGAAEPLVLLHGVASSRIVWRNVADRLAAGGRRVVAVDVPGFGGSEAAGPGFALDAVADRLAEGLGLERFDLVGHSLGGAVAVAVASRHPEAVRRLVLVAPAGLAPRAMDVAAVLGWAAELGTEVRRALGYQWVEHASARWALFATSVADPAALHPDDARLLLDASAGATRIADGVRAALEADLRDDLAAAPAPLGFIWGEADRVVPYAGLATLADLRPDAIAETLPRTGHIPQIERPAEFAAALERILAALA